MTTSAPPFGRIAITTGFILSVFGLLLFIWTSFGGFVPLAPKSYRFTAKFAEGDQLVTEADVRVAGVNVGSVKSLKLDERDNKTIATLEVKPDFAPVSKDSRAILRQKTLLGETFIEITRGSKNGPKIEEDGRLPDSQVQEAVQIDEIFQALDAETRENFRRWQRFQGAATAGRQQDISDFFGNFGPFAQDASELLETLQRQDRKLSQLFRNTGAVFGALTENESDLRGLITNGNQTFAALASRDDAIRDTFQVFPTFLRESRATINRLETFSRDTNPLINELRPVARELPPTLRSVRRLSPDLEDFFRDFDALITVSEDTLPSMNRVLRELAPLLKELDPFLAQLNPIIKYLEYYKATIPDWFSAPGAGIAGTLNRGEQGEPRHALRILGYTSAESLAIYKERLPENRGNGYLKPDAIKNPNALRFLSAFLSWDCKNTSTGGRKEEATEDDGSCIRQGNFPGDFGGQANPQVDADD